MSINEKNKRLLNIASSSQWKIVSQPDEQEDTAPVTKNRDERENRRDRQETGQRSLRDADAFYKNDTSNFLGELQKAKTLLYQQTGPTCKIDFFPSKRKGRRKEISHDIQGKGIEDFFSDTGVVPIPRTGQKNCPKEAEPEKLIVDVNDFVETFSAFREPVYLMGNRKSSPAPEVKSEVECLLDQVQLRRKNGKTPETPELVPDSPEHDSPGDTVDSAANKAQSAGSRYPREEENDKISPAILENDADQTQWENNSALCSLHSAISVEPEYTEQLVVNTLTILPLHEIRDLPEHDTICHVDEPSVPVSVVPETATPEIAMPETATIPEKMEMKETAVETESFDETLPTSDPVEETITALEKRINVVAAKETERKDTIPSRPAIPTLPGILDRLEEFASDRCNSLTDYIKDKVYDGSRLIAFCGMKRGDGCTTLTLLAARGITRHGLKTAVIDANFEFPQLNVLMTGRRDAQNNQASWVNILHGTADWETLGLTPKDMPLLTVFPLAENALVNWSQHEPERLQQATNRLVANLQEHFDLILLDCGCLEDSFEEITWGELALFQPDGVMIVCNPKKTPNELLEPCCREILGSGIDTYGVAENFV